MKTKFETLEEASGFMRKYREIENAAEAKIDIVNEAYMDGAIDAIEYKIELDAIDDWKFRTLEDASYESVQHGATPSMGDLKDE